MRALSTLAVGSIIAAVAFGLTACTPEPPMPVPSETADPSASATPEPTVAPEPELDPQGTAVDNLAYFDKVNRALITQGGSLDGRSFIDNLVQAGFSKPTMEVTPDRTSINAQADQIQFSVRINGTCLIGQYGNGKYNGVAADLLSDGKCLVGTTRPIDW
ncbi:MAG TPA: hypothetical protein VNR36_08450 [Pseudolysinimonas sp.]|nr:hypothetical protein [Pseudolysinimonas sp.]